jgi:hypothetical protein
MNPVFESPEIAVLYEFPGVPCRVAALAREGDDAYAVVDVGTEGQPYLYGISLGRREGGWEVGTSGSGPGWTLTDAERGLGTATDWGEAPEGAVRLRATLGSDTREVPVARGVYLVAWWRVPCPAAGEPRVDAFRVGECWVPAPPAPGPERGARHRR